MYVDTGSTVSSVFGTLPGNPFLSECQTLRFGLDLLNGIKPASCQLQFHFWKQEEVTGCQIRRFHDRRRADEVQCRRRRAAASPQVTYTTPNKRVRKLPTSTQLRATWQPDSLDAVVLPSTGASRYHNYCMDGDTSPEYFGYRLE
jgi:hypothetical protein